MKKYKNLILWPLSTITTFMTDIHTYRHGNSMTDPAQRAESVKKYKQLHKTVHKTLHKIVHKTAHKTLHTTVHNTVHKTVQITVHKTVHKTVNKRLP